MAEKDVQEMLGLIESRRKSGRGVEGKELRKYSQADQKEALRRQQLNMKKEGTIKGNYPPDEDADKDPINSLSILQKKFLEKKGYK